jgi:SAM-dependent methyltransferase
LTVHLPRVDYGCAVEQSPAMLRVAEERLAAYSRTDWVLQQGDAFDLPFQAGEFDAAMAFKLVRHFDRADRLRLLANLRRAVRPGGHVILDVANDAAYRWLHAKWGVTKSWIDDYWFRPDSLRSEMREAGLADIVLWPVQPWIWAQYYCWCHLPRVSPAAARAAGRALEHCPWGEPLEWIAVCRCA